MTIIRRLISADKGANFKFFLFLPSFRPDKGVLAIPNLAHLFFAKDRQKPNKLNAYAQTIRRALHSLCASPYGQSKALAGGSKAFFCIKTYAKSQVKNQYFTS